MSKLTLLHLYFSFCLIFGFGKISGQTTAAFSLEEARNYAVTNNYNVQNAKIDIEIARKKIWETTAIGLPQVNGSIDYNDFIKIPTMLIPGDFMPSEPGKPNPEFIEVQFGAKYNATLGLTASQLLFNGSYLVGLQTSKIFKRLSEQNLEKTELNVKEMVTQTYYLILVAQESEKLLDLNLADLNNLYYQIRELNKEGFVEETDVDQMKLNISTLENVKNSVQRQIKVAYNLLKFQMGIDLELRVALTENLKDIINRINFESLIAQNFNLIENIDYKLLNTREQLTFMNLKNEKAKLLPSLAAFYSYQENAQRQDFNFLKSGELWFPTTLVGLSLQVPIFGSWQKKAKIKQAQLSLEQVKNSKTLVEQGLLLEYKQAKAELENAVENFYQEKENIEISKKIYDKTVIKYKEGIVSSSDLTIQHNQFIASQSNYIQTVSTLLNTKNKLDKTLNKF